jgi:hypothetical protein
MVVDVVPAGQSFDASTLVRDFGSWLIAGSIVRFTLNNYISHIPDGAEQQEICGIARLGMIHWLGNTATLLTSAKDSAPDIYETPELTDDNSTAPVRPPDIPQTCD